MAARTSKTIALGFRVHLAWTAAVVLVGPARSPSLLWRGRIELADPAVDESREPYHEARECDRAEAPALVRRARRAIDRTARGGVGALLKEVGATGGRVRAAILVAKTLPPDDLDAILVSHARIHTAEGALFRAAVREACGARDIAVIDLVEGQLEAEAARRLGAPPDTLVARAAELGSALGPPWQQDHKRAALAAWCALA